MQAIVASRKSKVPSRLADQEFCFCCVHLRVLETLVLLFLDTLDLRKITTAVAKSEQAQDAHQVLCTGHVGKCIAVTGGRG